jgi:predicted Zn-dependent protease
MKKTIVFLAVAAFLINFAGCAFLGVGHGDIAAGVIKGTFVGIAESKKAAEALTPENEYYLGRAVAANIAGNYKIFRNATLQSYVNKICQTIVINSPRPDIYNGYHVGILDTTEINAFATPGGHIFLSRGLIDSTKNEDELAAVIAHEIGHIQLQHALTSIRNARYVNAILSGAAAGFGEALGGGALSELANIMSESVNEMVTTLVSKGFSKNQEYQADAAAVSLLAASGYNPSGLLEMLEELKKTQGNDKTAGFGKTHPTPEQRIAAAKKVVAKYTVEDTSSYRTRRYGAATR